MIGLIEQLRIGHDNFCYVIYSQGKAGVVDPGYDVEKILRFLSEKKLVVEYIITTHYHPDHSGECAKIKQVFPASKVVASEQDGKRLDVKPDVVVSDRNRLTIGSSTLEILLTPGHTPGGICVIVDDEALLTGDTLFIGDCGRTDLPGGNLEQMFHTLHDTLRNLPDHLIVYPGHDYGERPYDTLGNQKRTNKTLKAKTLEELASIP